MTSVNSDIPRNASDALDQFHQAAGPAIEEGKRRAGVLFDQSGDLIDTARNRASETAADLGKSVIAFTKKNPLSALLLAVGAGALLISAVKSVQLRR
jgi:hypothetical protein